MSDRANLVFEVATIKPSVEGAHRAGIAVSGRIFHAYNMTVKELLAVGLEVHVTQVSVRPGWADTEKFDVSGVPEAGGQPNENQWNAMLKKLLYERLQLRTRVETRHIAAYSLSVAKGVSKLVRTQDTAVPYPALYFKKPGSLVAKRANIAVLCAVLQNVVFDRPVVDRTGLDGAWDFTLKWLPDEGQFHGTAKLEPDSQSPLSSIYVAVREQLGLELSSGKPEVPVVVVEDISRPSAN